MKRSEKLHRQKDAALETANKIEGTGDMLLAVAGNGPLSTLSALALIAELLEEISEKLDGLKVIGHADNVNVSGCDIGVAIRSEDFFNQEEK